MRRFCRRLASWLVFAVVGLVVSDCTDSSVSPKRGKSAGLSIASQFSAGATSARQTYQSNGIDLDRVRVTITRLPSEILAEEELLLAGQPKEFTRDFIVQARVGEVLSARIEFRAGTAVLFAGSGPVVARAADDQSPADQVAIQAVGPGATATRVTVAPATGTFPTTAPLAFTARAFDQSNAEIQGAVFDWSVDNVAVGTVSALGVVQPTPTGGLLHVRATTLNGITGEAIVTFGNTGPGLVAVATQPSGAVSGVNLTTQPVVQIRDANNNVIASSTAAVTAAIASGSGTLLGTRTVTAVNGVATFTNLRVDGSGPHTLSFTATGFTAATSSGFTVTQNIASLTIQTQPGGATSGSPLTIQPIIGVLDNAGLPVGNAIPVTAAITSGTGTLSGTTSVTAVGGLATFTNLTITGSGQVVLTFSTTTPALQIASATFTVTQSAASLQIQTQPSGGTSGSPLPGQPVIRILDNAGLVVGGSTLAVSATIASGNGTVVSGSPVNAVNGTATFTSLRVDGTGPQTLTFSTTNPSLSVTSTGFAMNASPATQIVIRTQPGGAVSGIDLTTQPIVEFRDANNAIVTGTTGSVLAQITSGTGRLVGNTTVNAVNGVATFTNLRINGAGPHTISFTAIGLPPVTSASFTVTQTPASLFIRTEPAGSRSGSPLSIQPVIEIHDNANILIATSTLAVTATVFSSTNGAVIAAGGSVNAVGGVAMFTALTMTGSGGVTLSFSILTSAISIQAAPFAVNAPAPPP